MFGVRLRYVSLSQTIFQTFRKTSLFFCQLSLVQIRKENIDKGLLMLSPTELMIRRKDIT